MPRLSIPRARSLILIVIVWLVGTYVFSMFTGALNQTFRWLWSLLLALMSGGLLWFVRWRAERALGPVRRRWGYYAWYCVPTLVMLAPFAWRAYHWATRHDAPRGFLARAAAALTALLPVLLELGVPVILLSVVYLGLSASAGNPPSGPES